MNRQEYERVEQLRRIYNDVYCEQRKKGVEGGAAERAAMLVLLAEVERNDQAAAEGARVEGGEAVAEIVRQDPFDDGTPHPCNKIKWRGDNAEDDFLPGTKLYTAPPAPATAGAVPDGWKLVPADEPTPEMVEAGYDMADRLVPFPIPKGIVTKYARRVYRAVIAMAPEPPAS